MGYADAVHFDFDGALALACDLHRLGSELIDVRDERSTTANTALDGWLGAFGEQFFERKNSEYVAATEIAGMLQSEAAAWATQWKYAMDQENNNRWARECDRVRDSRSALSSFVGHFTGHDDLPDRPQAADVPGAPHFAATRRFVTY